MAVRNVVYYPNPVLQKRAEEVTVFDDHLKELVNDMIDTMYAFKGIGLAAPQIGVSKRIFVIDVSPKDEPSDIKVFINPEIVSTSEETMKWEEGCLSLPEVYEEVTRPRAATLKAQDVEGNWHVHEGEELFAICMQHELDHLNGVLFIDHISRLKRRRVLNKYKKVIERMEAEKEGGQEAVS